MYKRANFNISLLSLTLELIGHYPLPPPQPRPPSLYVLLKTHSNLSLLHLHSVLDLRRLLHQESAWCANGRM